MTTIEALVIAYLNKALDVPAYGDLPKMDTSAEFITVEKTGSAYAHHIETATIVVQSWAKSRAKAANLNDKAVAAMHSMAALPEICRCQLSTDYNYPDLSTKTPRYQAVFDVTYYR